MTTTTPSTKPGWVHDVECGQSHPPNTYALATISIECDDPAIPEVRNIGMKSILALSPRDVPDLYSLICSTDVRTQKVLQIAKNSQVSLSTWVPEENLQIRMQANARTFSSVGWVGGEYSFIHTPEVDLKRLRREMWASESFSGRTRAWHSNPTPGSNLRDVGDQRRGWTETLPAPREQSMPEDAPQLPHDDTYEEKHVIATITRNQGNDSPETRSFKNFALIIFQPYEVDVVRMAKSGGYDRRTKWEFDEDGWTSREVAP